MGRHSNGHRNLRVTKEMVISIVAAVLVLMVGGVVDFEPDERKFGA